MSIPVETVGDGEPHVAVIAGVHGDERSSLLIQHVLEERGVPVGTLHLIGPVNEAAWRNDTRFIDEDLNRTYPEPDGTTYESRLAQSLIDLVEPMDVVIDMHTFRMTTKLTVVQTKRSELVKYFEPDLIWFIDPDEDHNEEFERTLGLNLALNGTENFVVELPPVEEITEPMIERCISGVYNVITQDHTPRDTIPVYTRYKYQAPFSGIFMPDHAIMTEIREGHVIGSLFSSTTHSVEVKAEDSGMLLQRRHQSWIESGETVYALGERIDQ